MRNLVSGRNGLGRDPERTIPHLLFDPLLQLSIGGG
jgi:hypothetical protein